MTYHISTSAELGTVVRRGLREPVSFVADNWLVGPCAVQAETHVNARCDHWGFRGRERTRFLTSFRAILNALESPGRLVLWASRLWSDTAALWALCAWRLVVRPTDPDLGLVMLGGETASGENDFHKRYLHLAPSDARRGLAEIQTLSLTRAREMAACWRRLAGTSPILAGKRAATTGARQTLAALGAYQAGFFPRLQGHATLVSRFDALLFACLGDEWSSPLDVFVRRGADGDELRQWLAFTGDVFLAARLTQWATHRGSDAALESEPHQVENVMKAARYRLSKTGRDIQRHGLAALDQGAPLVVWGAVAYDPNAPWVVTGPQGVQPKVRRLDDGAAMEQAR